MSDAVGASTPPRRRHTYTLLSPRRAVSGRFVAGAASAVVSSDRAFHRFAAFGCAGFHGIGRARGSVTEFTQDGEVVLIVAGDGVVNSWSGFMGLGFIGE